MEFWKLEGDSYLLLVWDTPDSALRRASAFMKHVYQFDPTATSEDRRTAALSVSYEGLSGRFIRVILVGEDPWV